MKTFIKRKEFHFYLWVGAVWLLLWIFNASLNNSETFIPRSLNEIWRVLFIIVVNFIFFEYSLPFIIKKRSSILFNILIGILLISLQLILVSLGVFVWKSLGIHIGIYTSYRHVTLDPGGTYNLILDDVVYQAQGGVISLFFFGISKIFYDNFKLKQTAQKLRLEKQKAELNYLKSQTNPHFLFNTLNNIYSLSRDKSDLAPESILRLSKILRFMLYETSGEFISIEQELETINDYIALEKIRYDDSLRVNFKYEVENMKQQLSPLLLIPLVQNAFKHGVAETRIAPFLDIDLSVKENVLNLKLKNSIDKDSLVKAVVEGIGLSNLRKQLELLYGEYNLEYEKVADYFEIRLKVNLLTYGKN